MKEVKECVQHQVDKTPDDMNGAVGKWAKGGIFRAVFRVPPPSTKTHFLEFREIG